MAHSHPHSQPHSHSRPQSARGSYKQPGGKLVSATVEVSNGAITNVSFDGDFFAERSDGGEVSLTGIETALAGTKTTTTLPGIEQVISAAMPSDTDFVGVTAQGMAFAVARALTAGAGNLTLAPSQNTAQDPDHWAPLLADRYPENATHPARQVPLTQELIEQRWASLDLHLVDPDSSAREPVEPAVQMALDEVISRKTAAGELPPILRFWEWARAAIILGLNQSVSNEVDEDRARELGVAVVRRVTGGGAMFVEPGNTITYSLTTPLSFVDGLSADDSYGLCESWTFEAFASIGIAASHEPINDISSPAGKIGGAAQRRYPAPTPAQTQTTSPGALLHHTTMAYDIDAAKMLEVLRVNKEKSADKTVKSAAKRVDPMRSQSGMSRSDIIAAFAGWLRTNVAHLTTIDLPAEVMEEARDLARSKFATKDWIYRIP